MRHASRIVDYTAERRVGALEFIPYSLIGGVQEVCHEGFAQNGVGIENYHDFKNVGIISLLHGDPLLIIHRSVAFDLARFQRNEDGVAVVDK